MKPPVGVRIDPGQSPARSAWNCPRVVASYFRAARATNLRRWNPKADKRNKQGLTTMAALAMSSYGCYVNPRAAGGRRRQSTFRKGVGPFLNLRQGSLGRRQVHLLPQWPDFLEADFFGTVWLSGGSASGSGLLTRRSAAPGRVRWGQKSRHRDHHAADLSSCCPRLVVAHSRRVFPRSAAAQKLRRSLPHSP